ncbi:hypothetical protein [Psychrobacter sp. CAL346-MNA-CIBAN-0220]
MTPSTVIVLLLSLHTYRFVLWPVKEGGAAIEKAAVDIVASGLHKALYQL